MWKSSSIVKDLPPGEHALHFHQNAKCDPPDFKSAGPHFNPDQKEHGFLNPNGHHNGDMANFTVKPNGTAKATIKDADVVLGTGSEANSLFANGGTALMIHAKADDMKTDPCGQRRRPHRLRRDHQVTPPRRMSRRSQHRSKGAGV